MLLQFLECRKEPCKYTNNEYFPRAKIHTLIRDLEAVERPYGGCYGSLNGIVLAGAVREGCRIFRERTNELVGVGLEPAVVEGVENVGYLGRRSG